MVMQLNMAVQELFGRMENLHKDIVKARTMMTMRMLIPGGNNVASGRMVNVLHCKVDLQG